MNHPAEIELAGTSVAVAVNVADCPELATAATENPIAAPMVLCHARGVAEQKCLLAFVAITVGPAPSRGD